MKKKCLLLESDASALTESSFYHSIKKYPTQSQQMLIIKSVYLKETGNWHQTRENAARKSLLHLSLPLIG